MKISKTLTFGLLGVALAFNAIAEEPTMMYVVGKDGKLITTMNVDDIGKITFKDPFADPEPETATIRAVNGFWAGDFWGNTLNDVYLEMTDTEVKDGQMQYPGNFISLDLNVKAQEFEKLNIAGNYAPCTDVVPLYPSTFNCDGVTYINSYDASGHMTRHDVTGGSVNIAYAAGTYTIDLYFTFDDRDDYRARYNGPIGFTDDSGTKLSTLTSDYTPSVTSAKAAFGNWGNPSLPSVPLTLTLQGSKDTVQFLLNASKNSANTHDIDGQYVAESKIGVSETDYSVGAAHPGELKSIVSRSAKTLGIEIDVGAADEISRRSRGTPRIANRLVKRVRDFSTMNNSPIITVADAKFALSKMEIDELGLDEVDRALLRVMAEKFDGRPVGLETIAATINEDAGTIEDVYEPYLLQLGFIARTPRGRMLLRGGYEHIGFKMSVKQKEQLSLFEKPEE